MEIRFEPNAQVPGISSSVNLDEGSCLSDALMMAAPEMVNKKRGEYKEDPDIWDLKLNEYISGISRRAWIQR